MISRIQIEAAKSGDLPTVLQSMGIALVPEGHGYHFRDHDSLKLFRKSGIWLYKWWAQGGEVGDGIQYLQQYCGFDFTLAVNTLADPPDRQQNSAYQSEEQNKEEQWTSNKWQDKSEKLIRFARSSLFEYAGKKRLNYLINERGLNTDTIKKHRLGWLPAKDHMPSKILIPCYNTKGKLFRIRFRIEQSGQERYRISKGSNPYLPFPLGISSGKPVAMVESELDAILLYQETGKQIGVLALGSAAIKLTPTMFRFLNEKVPVVLICMDNDQAGKDTTKRLKSDLKNAIDWPVPVKYGKDLGEAWGKMDMNSWIKIGLKVHFLS